METQQRQILARPPTPLNPSSHAGTGYTETAAPAYAIVWNPPPPKPSTTEKFTKGWGLQLYQSDPPIYHPWYDALHRGKAAHFLMVKLFQTCHKRGWLKPGDLILDPFAGSGRTGIVGSMFGHPSHLVEIERLHAQDTIIKNLEFAKRQLRTQWTHTPLVHLGDARALTFPSNSFDAIITSPPYADQIHTRSTDATLRAIGKNKTGDEPSTLGTKLGYGSAPGQIGNLKIGKSIRGKETYEAAMEQVYREIYRVLKPGGIVVTITKDGFKANRREPTNRINRKLAKRAGLTLIDAKFAEVHAPLIEPPDLFGHPADRRIIGPRVSYFRRWHFKKNPRSLIRYELVMFFRKPYGTTSTH